MQDFDGLVEDEVGCGQNGRGREVSGDKKQHDVINTGFNRKSYYTHIELSLISYAAVTYIAIALGEGGSLVLGLVKHRKINRMTAFIVFTAFTLLRSWSVVRSWGIRGGDEQVLK